METCKDSLCLKPPNSDTNTLIIIIIIIITRKWSQNVPDQTPADSRAQQKTKLLPEDYHFILLPFIPKSQSNRADVFGTLLRQTLEDFLLLVWSLRIPSRLPAAWHVDTETKWDKRGAREMQRRQKGNAGEKPRRWGGKGAEDEMKRTDGRRERRDVTDERMK